MAFIQVEFFSESLQRCVEVKVLLPNDQPAHPKAQGTMKTLYLLHGYGNRSSEWIWHSDIVGLAEKYGICVVLPSGENSFYLDGDATGRQYASFLGKELPAYLERTFGLSGKREDHFLGGLSMGGFGATHTALQFSDYFAGFFSLSGAMIGPEVWEMNAEKGNGMANYAYYRLMFGDPRQLEQGQNNPEELVRRILKGEGQMPRMYIACGTEDFLLQANRRFANFLQEKKVPHHYVEGPGSHNFDFWNAYLEPAIVWLLEEEKETEKGV